MKIKRKFGDDTRRAQIRNLDEPGDENGFANLVKPHIEQKIADLESHILGGLSQNYDGDCERLGELRDILNNVDNERERLFPAIEHDREP